MIVELKFSKEMAKAALEGRKCATTRSEKKGNPGDTFLIEGVEFRILGVCLFSLGYITHTFFQIEGVNTPEEFENLWKQLHRGHFSGDRLYYMHFFARVGETE